MKRILIYGHDDVLVETRRQVLAKNGISTETATNRMRVEQLLITTQTDLIVLCSSVDVEEQESILEFAHRESPTSKILVVIHTTAKSPGNLTRDDSQVNAMDGPKVLVRAVRSLTSA